MDTDGLIDFIAEAGKLKRLPRTGWVESGVPDPESVADHSFRVALIALVLADAKGLDSLNVVRMALLHDLAEAETGDLTPTQKGADPGAKRAEDEAMVRLLNKLPEAIRGAYRSAWREFSEASTEEARLVRDADKLEMVIQASEYQQDGGDRGKLMRFWHAEINGEEAKMIRDTIKKRIGKI
ncbi:MAG: HD domain-containing protein [Candidatus Bathyarchaeota archaeon]|nr:HD domain-containing protein [Candidatus Bathyarchaeota archaeon]